MKYLTGNEIRQKYLDFFKERGHLVLPSASLIPHDDPTLLLIGAGMAPFKPYFTGKVKPPATRITTCQKCVRTGDIENVGRTARHHTYFEMLGNFSFGDYFKKEVIPWAWEFLTKVLELPADKLWITVYPKDQEAYDLWHDVCGVPAERIVKLEDNWWEIASGGPCGPDSEIHIDLGEERGCGSPDCGPGCDCGRFLELWNLVFTQYNKEADGSYTPLQHKNIDTGLGLERVASVLQEKPSNFETDLIFPIIEYACKVSGKTYNADPKDDISLKVIADHARSVTFMIGDGILPSNEGRGYILRRVLRRAIRHGRLLGIRKEFLVGAADLVIDMYGDHYTDLREKKSYIEKVIAMEENSFLQTLEQGTDLLNQKIDAMRKAGSTVLNGEDAFQLYDTFGFPWELTEEILEEQGFTMDKEGFEKAMEAQRERARAARNDKEGKPVLYETRHLKLGNLTVDEASKNGKVAAIFPAHDTQPIQNAKSGDELAVILTNTAFHAEGGGQLGDTGRLVSDKGIFNVTDTKKLPDGYTIQLGTLEQGTLAVGDEVEFEVNLKRRGDIARNHTATHLLHAALKQVLGSHVNQAGSYVGPDRLRFDFSHFSPLTEEELAQVEDIVNEKILDAVDVEISQQDLEKAKEMGAMALFGEKYGKIVRVVNVPGYSMELCGGVHVSNTSHIGLFKILSESSVGAGVRRIEAVTGRGALAYTRELEDLIGEASAAVKGRPNNLVTRINALQEDLRAEKHRADEMEKKLVAAQAASVTADAKEVKGVPFLAQEVKVQDVDALRKMGDTLRDKTGGVVVLAAPMSADKVNILVMATKEAVQKGIHAGKIAKGVAQAMGGNGGGRPDMAQAGGKDASKVQAGLAKALELVEGQLN
ncbi:alanine--tRNA ligase [Acidaminococcus fermentans]|uniref:alanine--tRNA ligase n=1 Tax=Acidaminococcus fermentans TaxID=905 RepID=UPI002E77C12E|nr:alanine--tRNA ligase [Acidaminococcus fermentans]MEE1597726.1 alanine--tRNA ligase [Acidaminococcus fermentans]MEE4121988.1 alanine--tRNA ligase [Acidaminococcus fermentans]